MGTGRKSSLAEVVLMCKVGAAVVLGAGVLGARVLGCWGCGCSRGSGRAQSVRAGGSNN